MEAIKYLDLKQAVIDHGFIDDITWAKNIKPCMDPWKFCLEYIFVVCNSGMKSQIARQIFNKILGAIDDKRPCSDVFGHKGKAKAIDYMRVHYNGIFKEYQKAPDKLEFCRGLPWIGDITKYHLVKNLGIDCIKPDRHLVRIANKYDTDPFSMCEELKHVTGDSLNTIDTTIWRAANLGIV